MSIEELELREREIINDLKNNRMLDLTSRDLEERERLANARREIKRELGKVKYDLLLLRKSTNLGGKSR